MRARASVGFMLCLVGIVFPGIGLAHNVTPGDAGYIQEIWGVHIIPFVYLGAKHMVTGYDHILFLLGVVFFLYKMKDVAIYVSLFALGHSLTMLAGVWFGWGINAYIIDAIIVCRWCIKRSIIWERIKDGLVFSQTPGLQHLFLDCSTAPALPQKFLTIKYRQRDCYPIYWRSMSVLKLGKLQLLLSF